MAIEMTCLGCGKVLHVPDAAAGKKGKCPHCGTILQVPVLQREGQEVRIYEALTALLHRGTDDSFVLIQEPRSKKFVQFALGLRRLGRLGMDVPCVALTSEEADRASQFFNEWGEAYPREYHETDPKTGKISHCTTFYHDFGLDARAAAKATIAFFVNVYGFPADVELSVEEN